MSARDPAVEAAQRAWDKNKIRSFHVQRVVAACEALAPIRELHQAFADYHRHRDDPFSAGVRHVLREFAELIYTDDELTGGEA